MNKLFQYTALAAFVGAGLGNVAVADESTTSGGIKIKTDDGKFDFALGGRIHFDGYVNAPDDNDKKIGSGAPIGDTGSDFEFRRVFVTLVGHLYNFEYHVDYDISNSNFQDVWVEHDLLPGGHIYVGQHKAWRSLDELSSNNNTPLLERNIASATGVYGGRDYTRGLFYSWNHQAFLPSDNLWAGASFSTLAKQSGAAQARTDGLSYNARVAYAPFTDKTKWAHIGASYSSENFDLNSLAASSAYAYGGRTGSSITLANYGIAAAGGGRNPHADTISAELAGTYGPIYLQGEYVNAAYHQEAQPDNTVDVYSITAAYAITGESRPYDKKSATYGAIKPVHPYGAFELVARYDEGRNDKGGGAFRGVAVSNTTFTAANPVTKDSVQYFTVGVNYYINPAVRFMLDYNYGQADFGNAGKDSPSSIGARMQLVF